MKVVTKLIFTAILLAVISPVLLSFISTSQSGELNFLAASSSPSDSDALGSMFASPDITISQEIPEKYAVYLSYLDQLNSELERSEGLRNVVNIFEEGGINIHAKDVSFYLAFTDEGLLLDFGGGINTAYKTIKIKNDLDAFASSAAEIQDIGDLFSLSTDIDLPFKYTIKLPQVLAENIR